MDDPFDARKVMLNDRREPTSRRRTVSLVTALRAALLEGVQDAVGDHGQASYLRQLADELTCRGIDGDCIVRYGLGPELLAAVVGQTLPYWLPNMRLLVNVSTDIEQEDPSPEPSPPWPHAETWEELLGPLLEKELGIQRSEKAAIDGMHQLLQAIVNKVYPWILSASMGDLLALKPPNAENF